MKELLSGLAIALTVLAFLPYIRSILRGATKPHLFSWLIWGSTTFVVFLAQLADHGGVGAWPIGVSGLITLYVAYLAWRRRCDISITGSDRMFLFFAFTALPVWYLTSDPFWAVLILTLVDLAWFGPTFRKAFDDPFGESLPFYAIMAVRNLLSAVALEHYSPTTLLFPLTLGFACLGFIIMVLIRRAEADG